MCYTSKLHYREVNEDFVMSKCVPGPKKCVLTLRVKSKKRRQRLDFQKRAFFLSSLDTVTRCIIYFSPVLCKTNDLNPLNTKH